MPIIRGRGLFQIFLAGSRALTTLVYYPIKLKNNQIKLTEHGLFKCSKFGFLINFQCQLISKNRGKSEIHKHYHRKNCKKTRAFVSIQLLT